MRKQTPAPPRRLARVWLALAASILGFLVAEAICRWQRIPYRERWTPRENALARFDPELGWSYLPGHTAYQRFDDRDVPFHFDADGIRVPTAETKLEPSRPSVLFVGCSFTMGHGLPYEETFVGQFAALPGMPYQAVNLGVQAYGSDQALLALEKFLPRFDTEVVVYTFLPVHIARNGNHDRRLWFPTARFLGTKPLYGLASDGRLVLEQRPGRYEDGLRSWFYDALKIAVLERSKSFPPYPLDLTREILRNMQALAAGRGARFVLLYWDLGEFYDIKLEVQRAVPVERVLDGLDVDLIRVSTGAPADWKTMLLSGSGHPNAELNRHVAHLLSEYFRAHGLVGRG
jgi:hypothetical protein